MMIGGRIYITPCKYRRVAFLLIEVGACVCSSQSSLYGRQRAAFTGTVCTHL